MTELTKEQIKRQDFVDNAIYDLIERLVPNEYRQRMYDLKVDATWDRSFFPEIRERIQDCMRVGLIIGGEFADESKHKAERKRFEQAFYPFSE